MLSSSDLSILNIYADTLTRFGVWEATNVVPHADEEMDGAVSIFIHRPFSARTENALVINQDEGRFQLLDGDQCVIAEGSTLADVLEPWRRLVEKLAA